MTTSASEAAAPAEPRRGRLGLVIIGVVTAVMACGFGVLASHVGQTPGIVPQTTTYDVVSDTSVELTYSVAKSKGDEVRCTVDAYDTDFAVLVQKEVTIPAGKSSVSGAETLVTPRRATGARVRDCRKM
ncbi:DUF4307 domain-containing protein [Actinomadura rubrisoli]|uniref:DUF4307 domain-containing protein n=1 Tax=Actinomadura rubrisoli TaxID=2530368 RepID=A0A4R5ARL4_9ACTN|nr:DUF4307 domain-containing protein [Actinomadura rubrisoli]TDD73744.1 DUF4307 domain-containing protein [Actinomadura rubrisoli]